VGKAATSNLGPAAPGRAAVPRRPSALGWSYSMLALRGSCAGPRGFPGRHWARLPNGPKGPTGYKSAARGSSANPVERRRANRAEEESKVSWPTENGFIQLFSVPRTGKRGWVSAANPGCVGLRFSVSVSHSLQSEELHSSKLRTTDLRPPVQSSRVDGDRGRGHSDSFLLRA